MTWSLDDLPTDRLIAEFSMWSADLGRLDDELERIAPFADLLHIDVADGHFSPALLFFPDLTARIKKASKIPIHVHLMIADDILLDQIGQFADAGADIISIHAENANLDEGLALIEQRGIVPGIVLQLHTPADIIADFAGKSRFITLLGTAIGIKGQGLDAAAPGRLETARRLADHAGGRGKTFVAADGAIREHTVPTLRASGADTVVLGSLAFNAPDLAGRMEWLRSV